MTLKIDPFKKAIDLFSGATVAIVYAHSFDQKLIAKHYLRQRTETLSGYADVVDLLGGYPVFFNIEQFLELAANPEKYQKIDLVIDVPGGTMDISNLLLTSTLANKMGKRVFPASAETIAIGQNKPITSKIAGHLGWPVPKEFYLGDHLEPDAKYIVKPICAGDSFGVKRLPANSSLIANLDEGEFLQEFISGYDLTTYIMMDPINSQLKTLASSLTIPEDPDDKDWFWDVGTKSASSGRGVDRFAKTSHSRTNQKTTKQFNDACCELSSALGVTTLARIDTRLSKLPLQGECVDITDTSFLEINVLPSITPSGSWKKHISNMLVENEIDAEDVHPLYEVMPPMQSAMLYLLLSWVSHSPAAPTTGVDQLK